MRPKTITTLIVILALVGIGFNSFFIVEQHQQAMVLMFGELRRVEPEPGLKFKVPVFEDVKYFDKRILDLNAEPEELILEGQRRLIVDAFVKYRIKDPLLFFQSVRTEFRLQERLNTVLNSSLRQVLGNVELATLLTGERANVMRKVRDIVTEQAKPLGIEVVDVRIKRADFPASNSAEIYKRMESDREKEAREIRAKGAEQAQRIRAQADKEKRVILAEANKQSEIIRGEGDAEAVRVFAEATSKDPEFYEFYRSMQAYQKSLKGSNTSIILSPDSEFLHFLSKAGR